jgi:hypothetical protein
MEAPVAAALVAAIATSFGWLANHWLTTHREEQRRRTEAQLRFVERQIEELYGPLVSLLHEGRRTFADLLQSLGRNYVFIVGKPLPKEELHTWLYWAENEFLPRNEKIKDLLKSKTHLIEGPEFPESYVRFLDHCNSWAINHRRWKDQGIEYSWRSKINWPEEFGIEVLDTFKSLKAKHARLLGQLSGVSSSILSPCKRKNRDEE